MSAPLIPASLVILLCFQHPARCWPGRMLADSAVVNAPFPVALPVIEQIPVVLASPNAVIKDGACPAMMPHPKDSPTGDIQCTVQCDSDADCLDSLKCCDTPCGGKVCRTPLDVVQTPKRSYCALMIDHGGLRCSLQYGDPVQSRIAFPRSGAMWNRPDDGLSGEDVSSLQLGKHVNDIAQRVTMLEAKVAHVLSEKDYAAR